MLVTRDCANCESSFSRTVSKDRLDRTRFCCKKCLGEWTAKNRGWDGVPWEEKDKEYHKVYSKKWFEENPAKRKEYWDSNRNQEWYKEYMQTDTYKEGKLRTRLKTRYKISLEQYNAMKDEQNGVCWLCGNPPTETTPLCVDHDGKTGIVRKILCRQCNVGIGNLKHNSELLRKAAIYLEGYSKEESETNGSYI